ncbi:MULTISPECIES: hypothetical protein [unclassified Streptomyces]|uniref:hypothetical protein n=1 Tax=unclassified Streptomyces TaxID=2593676 RepID=UPI003244F338
MSLPVDGGYLVLDVVVVRDRIVCAEVPYRPEFRLPSLGSGGRAEVLVQEA